VLGPEHDVELSGTPGGGGSATTIRRATWTVSEESDTGTVTYSGQGYQKTSDSSFTLINPVSITKEDLGGRVTEQIQATPAARRARWRTSLTRPAVARQRFRNRATSLGPRRSTPIVVLPRRDESIA
jgi:hypothetical protein